MRKEQRSSWDSHLLDIEETWWVRDHQFNARVVRVKRKVAEVTQAEENLNKLRAELDEALNAMNEERLKDA